MDGASSCPDDDATAHGLSPETARAMAQLARERALADRDAVARAARRTEAPKTRSSAPPLPAAARAVAVPALSPMAPAVAPSAHDDDSIPLSYQVYTPEALMAPHARPRSMHLSHASIREPAAKPSIAARLSLLLVSACVVVGTAALIMAGMSDEPRRSAPSKETKTPTAAGAGPSARPNATAPRVVVVTRPADSLPAIAALPAEPAPEPLAKPAKGPKGKRAAASELRGAAVPPNPFAEPPVAADRAPAAPVVQRGGSAVHPGAHGAATTAPANESSDEAQNLADRKLLEAAQAEQSL